MLGLKTSAFYTVHVLSQLDSGLDSIDGVKAVYLERTFGLN